MGICFSGCCFSDVQPAEATVAEVVVNALHLLCYLKVYKLGTK